MNSQVYALLPRTQAVDLCYLKRQMGCSRRSRNGISLLADQASSILTLMVAEFYSAILFSRAPRPEAAVGVRHYLRNSHS